MPFLRGESQALADAGHRVLAGPLISEEELRVAGAFELPPPTKKRAGAQEGATLFDQ